MAATNQQLLVQNVQLLSAFAMLELTNAMLPPMMEGNAVPPADQVQAAQQPILADLLALSSQQGATANTAAGFEAQPTTVVNNYYVQQVVAPEPAAEVPTAPPDQPQPIIVLG
ncbi:MAG: hypothetical protein WCL04_01865, partial [Verrucomicrobiota bacterium]